MVVEEEERARKVGLGYNEYEHENLCPSCSAYWHLGVANNEVMAMERIRAIADSVPSR